METLCLEITTELYIACYEIPKFFFPLVIPAFREVKYGVNTHSLWQWSVVKPLALFIMDRGKLQIVSQHLPGERGGRVRIVPPRNDENQLIIRRLSGELFCSHDLTLVIPSTCAKFGGECAACFRFYNYQAYRELFYFYTYIAGF